MYTYTSRSQTSTTHTSSRKGPPKEPFVFLSFFLFFSSLLFHLSHAFHVPLKVVVWGKSSSVMLSYKNPCAKCASTRAKEQKGTPNEENGDETTKKKFLTRSSTMLSRTLRIGTSRTRVSRLRISTGERNSSVDTRSEESTSARRNRGRLSRCQRASFPLWRLSWWNRWRRHP